MEIDQRDLRSITEAVQSKLGRTAVYYEAGQEEIVTIDDCFVDPSWGVHATVKKAATSSSGGSELGDRWQISAAWEYFSISEREWYSSSVGGWRMRFI